MVEYTWNHSATEAEVAAAKAEASEFVNSATDAQQEVQVLIQAIESLYSKYETDVEFGREVIRIFLESF